MGIKKKNAKLSNGYIIIPAGIQNSPKISNGAKVIYGILTGFMWEEKDYCYPSIERLKKRSGLSEKSIYRYIRELKEKGLMEVENRGIGKTNLYRLTLIEGNEYLWINDDEENSGQVNMTGKGGRVSRIEQNFQSGQANMTDTTGKYDRHGQVNMTDTTGKSDRPRQANLTGKVLRSISNKSISNKNEVIKGGSSENHSPKSKKDTSKNKDTKNSISSNTENGKFLGEKENNTDTPDIPENDSKEKVVREVIDYFNEVADTKFKYNCNGSNYIKKLLNEGYSLEDFKHVVNVKYEEWSNEEGFENCIRPSTFFNSEKFENYLNQKKKKLPSWLTAGRVKEGEVDEEDFDEEIIGYL